jgi:uncharacterized iron-regulated membrane protein
MTKRLWKLHSWLGLLAGLGLLVIGATGSLLVFRDEIDGIVARDIMRVEPTEQGRLSWDELHAAAKRAWPDHAVTGFGPRRDPKLADLIYLKSRSDGKFVAGTLDPYTGRAISGPLNPSLTFTGLLLELHYTWFAEHVGMLITGIFAVLLCLLGLSGVWLYRGFWRSFCTLRWKQSARIFFSDLHKMVGISSVVFNLILGFTGAYWNLTHVATDGLSHHEEEPMPATGSFVSETISLNALADVAKKKLPGFDARWVTFPSEQEENLTFWGTVTPGFVLSGDYNSSAAFDPKTGALKEVVDMRQASLWAKITDSFAPLHYGTFGGLPVKILWCVLGFAPGVLAVSGFMIWWRRGRLVKRVVG